MVRTLANLSKLWQHIDFILFPPIPDQNRSIPLRQYLLLALTGGIAFSAIASFLPATGVIGYDWVHYFSLGKRGYGLEYYPPWMTYVHYLTWPGLLGVTFTGLALALYQRRASPLIMGLAFFSMPVWWVIFLGQIDGLVLFGLTNLPWLMPLVTIKPQVAYFACFARKQYLVGLLVWLIISIGIWGLWPLDILQIQTYRAWQELHDINLWPWSLPLVMLLLWLSRGDMDMLMLAGTFAMPYLHSYHYFLVTPALARVEKRVTVLAVMLSWLPLLANWLGPTAWYLGHLFPTVLWISLYSKRRRLLRCETKLKLERVPNITQ